jgi:hypothetical protein
MNWKYTDKILRSILAHNNDHNNEFESVANTKKELILHLKSYSCWKNLPTPILTSIEKATTFYSFNNALDKVYDYADANKIWIEF